MVVDEQQPPVEKLELDLDGALVGELVHETHFYHAVFDALDHVDDALPDDDHERHAAEDGVVQERERSEIFVILPLEFHRVDLALFQDMVGHSRHSRILQHVLILAVRPGQPLLLCLIQRRLVIWNVEVSLDGGCQARLALVEHALIRSLLGLLRCQHVHIVPSLLLSEQVVHLRHGRFSALALNIEAFTA